MIYFSFWDKVSVYFVSSMVICLVFLPLILVLILIGKFTKLPVKVVDLALAVIPAFFGTSLVMMAFDNFTYTVFKLGIVSTTTNGKAFYAIAAVYIFVRLVINLAKSIKQPANTWTVPMTVLCSILWIVSLVTAVPHLTSSPFLAKDIITTPLQNRPNIILISADGLSADHMSLYGYERKTTPFIDELAKNSLVSWNNFSNSSSTSGSLISIYTGKLPITTRVLYPPDTLEGKDRTQHIPGLLRSIGYYAAQITVPFYGEAENLGLINGFDWINEQTISSHPWDQLISNLPLDNIQSFLPLVTNRLFDRYGHIFFIREMINPYKLVTSHDDSITDEDRVNQALDLIEHTNQPLFLHIHLLATHGGDFYPSQRVFSVGEEQQEPWMDDFYDDAILDFDTSVKTLVEGLTTAGKYQNSIIVVFSDHAERWTTAKKIPLIIHFPENPTKHDVEF